MNDRLQSIEANLAEELGHIEASLSQIDEQRNGLLADRERITASLAALRPAKASPKKKRGQPQKPCATKTEVAAVVRDLIELNGPCPEEDLVGLAEARLREEGRSLSGFKLRYDAIRRDLLVVTGDGRLTLASQKPQETPR